MSVSEMSRISTSLCFAILEALMAALVLALHFQYAVFGVIVIMRLHLFLGPLHQRQLLGEHQVLVGAGRPVHHVFVSRHDAPVVGDVNSAGRVPLVLLILVRLQVAHDLTQVKIARSILLLGHVLHLMLPLSLHIHLHHIEKVLVTHRDCRFSQDLIILLIVEVPGVRTAAIVSIQSQLVLWTFSVKNLVVTTHLVIEICYLNGARGRSSLAPLSYHLLSCSQVRWVIEILSIPEH